MKAIRVHRFGGPDVLRLEETPTPFPSDSQVLVRVHAVGVNPVETYIRSGVYASLPRLPYTPGKDAAGVVEQIGSAVKNCYVGQRVYTSNSITGSYAQFALCESADVHPLPERVSFAQGAGVNTPCATAYRALFQRARARAGETVLIHGGSGSVGLAAIQLARANGMIVIATGGSERGLKAILKNGGHHALDHHAPDYLDQIMRITGERGVNVILEMLANVNLGQDLTVLARSGRVVVIGSRGKVEINPRDAMLRDAHIMGMMLSNASAAEQSEIYSALGASLESGVLRPVIGRELPLAEAATAHQIVMEPGAYGKIVLVPEPALQDAASLG